MSSQRQLRSREQKEELLQRQQRSGLSIKSFCIKHGISIATFHNWNQQFKNTGTAFVGADFTELDVQTTCEPFLFAEVKGIRLYQVVSADFLKALL